MPFVSVGSQHRSICKSLRFALCPKVGTFFFSFPFLLGVFLLLFFLMKFGPLFVINKKLRHTHKSYIIHKHKQSPRIRLNSVGRVPPLRKVISSSSYLTHLHVRKDMLIVELVNSFFIFVRETPCQIPTFLYSFCK